MTAKCMNKRLDRLRGGRKLVWAAMLVAAPVLATEDDHPWWKTPGQWMPDSYDGFTAPFESANSRSRRYGDNAEQQLNSADPATQWILQDEIDSRGDRLQLQTVTEQVIDTVKLQNVVPPIHFASGEAKIPPDYVARLRDALARVEGRHNVRLHFLGHTDNASLSPELERIYGDNQGLSRERAGTTAEFFQRALSLPAESISYEGVGDSQPIASNTTESGRAQNRRVEVEVWYDEITERQVEKEVLVAEQMHRVKVCRVETVCKLRYKEGYDKRAKVKNLVAPLRYDENNTEITESFLRQLQQALDNLSSKQNVTVRFIGHTDNIPLSGRDARIYGTHLALSRARARRAALAVQDALGLTSRAIESTGEGARQALASNDTAQGRALNRRVEVEFWYDDPLQALPDEPQLCPEQSGAETVTRVYDPPSGAIAPIPFTGGEPSIPAGYSQRLQRLMGELKDKANVRLRFVGYIANERLDRRTAAVYGDDIGLSTARARRVMEQVREEIALADSQVEFEGHGYVQTDDVVNAGFIESDQSRVTVAVIYDELALLDDLDGMDITRITREVETQSPFALNLMRITVDGKPVDDPGKSVADVQRCTDVALESADIQLSYDNLTFKPRLNLTAWPTQVRFNDDINTSAIENRVRFKLYSNYRSEIEKAEVRLFHAEQSSRADPLAVIPLDADGEGQWQAEFDRYTAQGLQLKYLLRVYDRAGRYDQTQAQSLWVVDQVDSEKLLQADEERELLTGFGETRLAEQQIPLSGGSVRVQGDKIPEGYSIWVAGRPVPLGYDRTFVAEELLPAGLHTVEVAVLDEQGNGELFLRDFKLEENDWFYVGIADLTVARDNTNGPARLVTQDEVHFDNDVNIDGRLAFFTRGKFGRDWWLSASADTREGEVGDLFSNFMDKSPDAMFRRIDPDYYYPTFGDDSTVEEGAPTLGKFYLKLQQQDNYGLWGNFDIHYSGNGLAHVDRTLYGANVHLQGDDLTGFGDPRYSVDLFAADPGTVASRDEFRGTGGSLYYLRHQDILQGSERIRVEVRDRDSGLVLAVKNLIPGLDYDIDYFQGRVLLTEPLSPSIADAMLINSDVGDGNQVFLVSRYEYTPGFTELNTLSVGGQADYWFGDSFRLGLTVNDNEEEDVQGSLGGVDLTWRKNSATWIKLEASQSDGAGVNTLNSVDGGFTFDPASVADVGASANGIRLESSLALNELHQRLAGQMTWYVQSLDAGYAAPGLQTTRDLQQYGTTLRVPVTATLDILGKLDVKEQNLGLETTATEIDADYRLNDHWSIRSGIRHDERIDNSPVVPVTQEEGKRTDLRVQGEYESTENWSAYSFLQSTLSSSGNRDDNDRAGIGGRYRFSDRMAVSGEISGGDLGNLGRMGTEFQYSDRTNIYLTYALENERSDNGVRARKGSLVSGFRTRYSDTTSMYMEERYTYGELPTGLTHAAGVDMALFDRWNFGANLDIATLSDWQTAAEIERKAVGLKVGYRLGESAIASALEYRVDNIEDPQTALVSERTTWLTKNSAKVQLSDDWRLIAKLNLSESESSQGEFYDGSFAEGVLGYAYRPVSDDRLNALFKYTYFYNMPTTDQVILVNTAAEYVQKSHILSADITYDLTRRWSVGGKYAVRRGELSLDRVDPQFFRSDAALYVLRTDWHFTHDWDALLEARLLDLPDAQDRRNGLLAAIYRHLGQNMKVGIGYNATDFSDDLTDLDYDSKGFFINAIGKF
ncbi:OmpA family protein [Proteobacteria bacterium 005FR1]|nr:OmpA family protein [Proteobacteria bacterium 005FR1]